MLNICSERLSVNPEDPWALSIQSRIYQCIDFAATEARYHQSCQVKFRLKRGLESDTKASGRKRNKTMMDVFLQTCDWLEDQVSVQSLRDFMEKMREYASKDDLDVYDKRYIKKLLHRHYEKHITFSEEIIPVKEVIANKGIPIQYYDEI